MTEHILSIDGAPDPKDEAIVINPTTVNCNCHSSLQHIITMNTDAGNNDRALTVVAKRPSSYRALTAVTKMPSSPHHLWLLTPGGGRVAMMPLSSLTGAGAGEARAIPSSRGSVGAQLACLVGPGLGWGGGLPGGADLVGFPMEGNRMGRAAYGLDEVGYCGAEEARGIPSSSDWWPWPGWGLVQWCRPGGAPHGGQLAG